MTGPITTFRPVQAELGQTHDPTALVPGDPAAVQDTVDALRGLGTSLAAAGEGLQRIDTGGWTGTAADRFRAVFHPEPRRWTDAGHALTTAADALDAHVHTLAWAQGQASEAIALWDQAEAETAHAKAEHRAAVDQARQAAPFDTLGMIDIPFEDTGQGTRQAAREVLARARTQLAEAGDQAEGTIADSRDQAPPEPRWWQKAWHQMTEYRKGVYEATADMGQFLWSVSSVRMLTDPAGYVDAVATVAQGAQFAVQHPIEFARAVVDWETWQSNPARALGRLAPDLALTVATGGSGGAAAAAARGARTAKAVSSLGAHRQPAPGRPPGPVPVHPGGPPTTGPVATQADTDFGPTGTQHPMPETASGTQPTRPSLDDDPEFYDPKLWDREWYEPPDLGDDTPDRPPPSAEPHTPATDTNADTDGRVEAETTDSDNLIDTDTPGDTAGTAEPETSPPDPAEDGAEPGSLTGPGTHQHPEDKIGLITEFERRLLEQWRRDLPELAHLSDAELLALYQPPVDPIGGRSDGPGEGPDRLGRPVS